MAQNGLTGNLSYDGQISVTGDNATGINIGSGISGDFAQNGSIATAGLGAQAINIDADIQGGFVSSGSIVNTGFRSTQFYKQGQRSASAEILTEEFSLMTVLTPFLMKMATKHLTRTETLSKHSAVRDLSHSLGLRPPS